MSEIWPYVAAIVPTILVATLFYFLIRSMIEGDRRERLAQSRFEAEQDRARVRPENTAGEMDAGSDAGATANSRTHSGTDSDAGTGPERPAKE